MSTPRALFWTLLLGASAAAAQERPREDDIFGGSKPAQQPAQTQESPAKEGSRPAEDSMFGAQPGKAPASEAPPPRTEPVGTPEDDREAAALKGGSKDAFETGEAGPSNPLTIGGTFYMRTFVNASEEAKSVSFSAPTLVDGYFDARPNEQIRGFLLARLSYDPTLGATSTSPITGLATGVTNPTVGIDQLWLRFDIARTIFVTAGRQHVRWGVSHLWAPSDYLTPQRRDPLASFDQRLGASMLKLHLPWEAQGWNFYAVGMFDSAFATAGQTTASGSGLFNPGSTGQTTSTSNSLLNSLGGATRAEILLGKTELGLDAVFQPGRKPRFGVDLSSALGPLDVYADAGFHQGTERDLYRFTSGTYDPNASYSSQVEAYRPEGTVLQAAGGLSYTAVFNDNDTLTLGAEYFYNSIGYDDAKLYPWLLIAGGYQPFYTGKHYGALTVVLTAPGNWDKVTFHLSTIGNLSDQSFISRLDFFIRVLTHLQVEAFAQVHYGNRGGEFRLAADIAPGQITAAGPDRPAIPSTQISVPAPLLDVGLALRLDI